MWSLDDNYGNETVAIEALLGVAAAEATTEALTLTAAPTAIAAQAAVTAEVSAAATPVVATAVEATAIAATAATAITVGGIISRNNGGDNGCGKCSSSKNSFDGDRGETAEATSIHNSGGDSGCTSSSSINNIDSAASKTTRFLRHSHPY